METPLECTWREWDAFMLAFAQKTQESAASGLEPTPPESSALRTALARLSPNELGAFLDDSRWKDRTETAETPEPGRVMRLMLLCSLLAPSPEKARVLAARLDDPFGAKSQLASTAPLPGITLFFTLRWRVFLQRWYARKAAVSALQALRQQIIHVVQHQGDAQAHALLKTHDSPALTRELRQVEQERTRRPHP